MKYYVIFTYKREVKTRVEADSKEDIFDGHFKDMDIIDTNDDNAKWKIQKDSVTLCKPTALFGVTAPQQLILKIIC